MKAFRFGTLALIPIGLLCSRVAPASGQPCALVQPWRPAGDNLKTRWTAQVQPDQPLNEYPRPELQRERWQNLNGLWDYAIADSNAADPPPWQGKILVPFCIESSLSGLQKRVSPGQCLWYHREFRAKRPAGGGHLLLHFGACDWRTVVLLNGKLVGSHAGGYDPFTFDLTPFLSEEGDAQTLTVQVFDATDEGEPVTREDENRAPCPGDQSDQPRGKQTAIEDPNYFFYDITYTPATGLWQTVWLEEVPGLYIERLVVKPDLDAGVVEVTAVAPDGAGPVAVAVRGPVNVAGGDTGGAARVTKGDGMANAPVRLTIPDPQAWSPERPALYDLEIACGPDRVRSYFGFRTIERRKDAHGTERFYLNHRPIFLYGPLDQGYWPDGVYTAPTDEALAHDLDVEKAFGFNCVRKHIKVEPARWYYWADRKGLLVWQDFPAAGPVLDAEHTQNKPDFKRSPAAKAQLETEMRRMVETLSGHPSVILWTVFNEAWGQYDTERVTGLFQRWDPSRLVDSVSGWNDRGCGDLFDEHDYNPPARDADGNGPFGKVGDPGRIVVVGEYGGLGLTEAAMDQGELDGHLWHKRHWAYRQFANPEQLRTVVLDGIARTGYLARQGLGAAIYTQLTDVEGEVNGLMTYDREKFKVPPEMVHDRIQAVIREGSAEGPGPAAGVLVPGAEVSLKCLGPAPGPMGVYLDGSADKGTVGLAPDLSKAYRGTRWRVGHAEDGAVTLECLGDTAAGAKWLDARTAEGAAGLAPSGDKSLTGTKWQVWRVIQAEGDRPEVVALRCLGDADGPRWLNGQPAQGSVNLAPNTDAPFTGTQWEVRPYQPSSD
ncbi:MAG: beta-galactosidase [Verrucomicrobia bacterium]|nr:beta-galactosidase [Verrucomicrobiota bacterium]